jgi:hypothetical protein
VTGGRLQVYSRSQGGQPVLTRSWQGLRHPQRTDVRDLRECRSRPRLRRLGAIRGSSRELGRNIQRIPARGVSPDSALEPKLVVRDVRAHFAVRPRPVPGTDQSTSRHRRCKPTPVPGSWSPGSAFAGKRKEMGNLMRPCQESKADYRPAPLMAGYCRHCAAHRCPGVSCRYQRRSDRADRLRPPICV